MENNNENLNSEQKMAEVKAWLAYADNLTKYGVMPRYPNEIEVDEYMAKTAVAQASKILEWAKGVIIK